MRKTQNPAPTAPREAAEALAASATRDRQLFGEHDDAAGACRADDRVESDLEDGEPGQGGRDCAADTANGNRRHASEDHAAAAVAIDHARQRERTERGQRDPREQARDAGAVEVEAGSDPRRRDRNDRDREALVEEHRDQRQDGQALAPAGIRGGSELFGARGFGFSCRRGIAHKLKNAQPKRLLPARRPACATRWRETRRRASRRARRRNAGPARRSDRRRP